jgi:hypothetical protein
MEHYKDFLTVLIDHERKQLASRWLRVADSTEFREGMLYLEDCIVKHKLLTWLFDALKLGAPALLDQRWTVEHIIAILEKTELRKVALIMPGDYIMHMIGEKMRKKVYKTFGKKILLECFSREDHAQFWLNSTETSEENAFIV